MRQRATRWAGFALALFTAFVLLLDTSALAVMLDLRPALLLAGSAAVLLLGMASMRAVSAVSRAAMGAGILVGAAAAGLSAWDLWFTYRSEPVAFTSGGVTLHGTLYLPRTAGPYSAVVLVHGAGQEPRDEYGFYARAYARRGIAALAYDKRGSGESGGDVETATFEQLASDVASAMTMLRGRGDIVAGKVGIWGLSEGEWVAPLAATMTDPAFLVLVSASAMTPSAQVEYETGANVLRAGFTEEDARQARALYARVSAFQRTDADRDGLNRALADARSQPWFEAARYLEPSVPDYARVQALPWFPAWRARMDFDALPLLRQLRCPVLALVGGADPKNDGAGALARIEAALAAGGNPGFAGTLYPRAGHGVIEWRLPFGLPPPWFADGYLERQLDWVHTQVAMP